MILSVIMQLRCFFLTNFRGKPFHFQFVGSTTVQGDVKLIMTYKSSKKMYD